MFNLKDLDRLHYFLGIEATRDSVDHLHLSQTQYIKEIWQRANMHEAKLPPTPMITSLHLTQDCSTSFEDPTLYRSIVGALQYVTITQPKLSFYVNKIYQVYASTERASLESSETHLVI